jgi:hypothetical protein
MKFEHFHKSYIQLLTFCLKSFEYINQIVYIMKSVVSEAEVRGIVIGSSYSVDIGERKQSATSDKLELFRSDSNAQQKSPDQTNQPEVSSLENNKFNFNINNVLDILNDTIEAAHLRCAKYLGYRRDQHQRLNQKDFYRVYKATCDFIKISSD